MEERQISFHTVRDLMENGTLTYKDERHCWIFKAYPDRHDNLVCAAAISGTSIVIKTLMTHWREHPE
uniref:DUF4258 domain-containing protein n=1 Tax=Candidatus Kentrum sp. DK TaxID=2126562 RepID=A0A450T8X9_9GAMM|nr:MAG: hypothetical protein BECKDK2373C_GA0170839_105029 [Candidatus Kentron sp. DK]VFJ63140.1 MAG: hypothetical protein BECKDK2373B_GA0170837_11205 [Candidatus Kentron sp. DK]